jgi:hypothetical protein
MKKLAATISGVAAVLAATSVVYCPTAAADLACPLMSSDEAGVTSRMAWQMDPANPYYQRHIHGDPSADVDMENFLSTCMNQPASAQNYKPPPPVDPNANGDPDLAALHALGSPQSVDIGPNPSMDCEGMYNSETGADALNIAGQRVGDLHARGIPGLSQIQSAPQAVCGAVNAGINQIAPNPNAAEQASTGGCNTAQMLFNIPVDLCGNGRPAG